MSRRRRVFRGAVLSAVLLAVMVSGGCVVTSQLAERYGDSLPRDPATGIVVGAEPRTLTPENPRGAVLLVHGFVGSPRDFGGLPERLAADGWHVEAMLLPGNGSDPRDLRDVVADDYINNVKARLSALRAQYPVVILGGFSMGAAVSTVVAADTPVDALVLGAPFAGVTYRWYYILPPQTWGRLVRPVVPWLYKGRVFIQVNRPEAKDELFSYDWIPAAAFRTLDDLGARVNSPGVPEGITCPVLWIHSPNDVAASFGAAKRVYDRLASSEKAAFEVPRSNHHVFVDYDRDVVIETVAQFLEGVDTAATQAPR